MARVHLTDKLIEGLELTSDWESRYEIFDASVNNLAIRVGSINKSFVLLARFRQGDNSTRRKLGKFPDMTTEAARVAAHRWNEQLAAGIDPTIEVERAREAEALRLRSTFASVVRDYVAYIPNRPRNLSVPAETKFIESILLNPSKNPWLNKPISEVTDLDVMNLVKALRARTPAQAFTCFRTLKTFFRWAMAPDRRLEIGLQHNPIEFLSAKTLQLEKNERDRVLGYEETHAFLKASTEMPYPYGPCLRTLIETGQRIGAVSGMRWSQLNLERKLWTIPGSRSRRATAGRTSKAQSDHEIPLSDNMCEMLRALKVTLTDDHGDYVFSFTRGATPLGSFSNLKRDTTRNRKGAGGRGSTKRVEDEAEAANGRFDRLMRDIVTTTGIEYNKWVWHDIRRTVRTHLDPITGRTEVAEAAIGHGQKGIVRVYNLHKFRPEIRRGFNAWSSLLRRVEAGKCTIAEWEHDNDVL
ncbi:tyrosine-type recombinase/integrase [Rhizobium oryzicola]|uniref:Integrase family protein n=1 Tax=Rhizobium oryzicola TaxID=1232668 RepID=A0ABT8T3G6_9HYPH|nr:integrase family protein [Rhizobium oryzicola]MDO1585257.1 integrase family protein [Rhizobium oryzicola]